MNEEYYNQVAGVPPKKTCGNCVEYSNKGWCDRDITCPANPVEVQYCCDRWKLLTKEQFNKGYYDYVYNKLDEALKR